MVREVYMSLRAECRRLASFCGCVRGAQPRTNLHESARQLHNSRSLISLKDTSGHEARVLRIYLKH